MRTVFSLLVIVAFAAGAAAQEATPPDPAKEIAALKQQVAQLQQKTPAELTKAAQDGYAAIFKEAKEKAQPGCKAAGGKLLVMVGPDGRTSVTCEL